MVLVKSLSASSSLLPQVKRSALLPCRSETVLFSACLNAEVVEMLCSSRRPIAVLIVLLLLGIVPRLSAAETWVTMAYTNSVSGTKICTNITCAQGALCAVATCMEDCRTSRYSSSCGCYMGSVDAHRDLSCAGTEALLGYRAVQCPLAGPYAGCRNVTLP